jgi:hypothetical protein
MEKISIQTVPITIRVMEVGGKRMTLAVFNQIRAGDFFGEEMTDEDRESSFIGWVSHKEERFILFHIGGYLKKDKYEYQSIDRKIKESFILASRNLEHWEGIKDKNPEMYSTLKASFEKALKDRNEDVEFCHNYNDGYAKRFTDETQIFIAI